MEQETKPSYDSDVILCENIPDTISVTSTPERHNKVKKPKRKWKRRKVERGVNFINNMETLLITQKLKVKKKKIKCIININRVCKKKSNSIVRFPSNVCKKEAYYQRILPVCLRKMCSEGVIRRPKGDILNCCRSTKNHMEYLKGEGLSPVSSIALAEIPCNNISYDEVSDGSFSNFSEEELDTLIKRTKQRDKHTSHQARECTSTPILKVSDLPSPYSIETDKPIHSDTTMILSPLLHDVYSPTASFAAAIDDQSTNDTSYGVIDMDISYSPSSDFNKLDNVNNFSVSKSNYSSDVDNMPYSPTLAPETVELDYNPTVNLLTHTHTHTSSPIFTSIFIKMEDEVERSNSNDGYVPYSPTSALDMIPLENENRFEYKTNVIDEYSPRSPTSTMTPDINKCTIKEKYFEYNRDIHDDYSSVTSEIKQEKIHDESTTTKSVPNDILTSDFIKKEDITDEENSDGGSDPDKTDFNMNQSTADYNLKLLSQVDSSETVVKREKVEYTHENSGHTMLFQNNIVKTENEDSVKGS